MTAIDSTISDTAFGSMRRLVETHTGITLAESKRSMLQTRLRQRLKACGFECFDAYTEYLRQSDDKHELAFFIDAVTTHHTFFFRESEHFDYLARSIQHDVQAGKNRFRVWSAACSSGEEPHSLLMTLYETLGEELLDSLDLKILATDVSSIVLAKAHQGEFSSGRLRGVSPERIERFFEASGSKGTLRIRKRLRDRVTYKRLDLRKTPYPMRGPLDAVLCRNVLIYFAERDQRNVLRSTTGLLAPGGLLFVGKTESAMHADAGLEFVKPAVYRRTATATSADADGFRNACAQEVGGGATV